MHLLHLMLLLLLFRIVVRGELQPRDGQRRGMATTMTTTTMMIESLVKTMLMMMTTSIVLQKWMLTMMILVVVVMLMPVLVVLWVGRGIPTPRRGCACRRAGGGEGAQRDSPGPDPCPCRPGVLLPRHGLTEETYYWDYYHCHCRCYHCYHHY